MAKRSRSPTGEPGIPTRGTVSSRGASSHVVSAGPALGWNPRILLIWAITGWALASLLGILLAFHGIARRPPAKPVEMTLPTPAPEPLAESNAARNDESTAAETTTTVQAIIVPSPAPIAVTPEISESNDAAVIAALLRHAAAFTAAGEFKRAAQAYDEALERDPDNADFKLLREQVAEMRAVAQQAQRDGAPVPLRLRVSPTEYVAPRAGSNEVTEPNLGVSVRRATQAPEFPGELIIELRPGVFKPGDPYVMRVRIYNKGNRPIDVESLEVVRTVGERVAGRGEDHLPSVPLVNPRDTSLLWEHQDIWEQGQETGSVAVRVGLVGGGQLMKSLSW